MEIPVLSRRLTNDIVDLDYPCLKVLSNGDALALVLNDVEQGDVPVVCEFEGDTYIIAHVCRSALVIDAIRKVSPIEWYLSSEQCVELKTAEDVLEVI